MTIPDKIKIGGLVYSVELVDTVDLTDHNTAGIVSYSLQKILIDNHMGLDFTNKVFLHELLHVMFKHCGLDQDESVIDRLAYCLYEVLKENDINFRE